MDARAGAKPIPLPLTPMVLPYMRQARVAFRIERVPQTARLSRGRKNDDHSWSLSDTEIKDVAYVPPRDGTIPATLAIRVIRVDSGDTLGVIEVQMPEEPRRQAARAQARASADPAPQPRRAPAPPSADADEAAAVAKELVQAELSTIRAELNALQTSLASRDTELTNARAEVEKNRDGGPQHVGAALNDVEKWWRAAEAARLAEAKAEWEQQTAKAVAEARAQAQGLSGEQFAKAVAEARAQAEAKAREDFAKAVLEAQHQAAAKVRDEVAKAVAETQEQAASKARDDVARAIAAAQEQAKAKAREEIAKAVAEAQEQARAYARDEIAKALADAQARDPSARGASDHAELRRLRSEMAGLQEKLAARTKELAAAQTATAAERARWQQEFVTQLGQAENVWKANEAGRLAAAEARANEKDAELVKLRREMVALGASVAERSNEVAKLQSAFAEERSRLQQESAAAVAKAETAWKIAEAGRLAAAEGHASDKDGEVRRANAELSATQASLAKVAGELAEAHSAMIKAREEWQRDQAAALASAERIWKAGEAARIAALEAQWKQESVKTLAEARAEAGAMASDSQVPRLRAELSAAEALVSKQKSELAELHRAHLENRAKWQQEAAASVAEAEKTWKMDEIARMTSAKAQWQQQMAKAVAEARSSAAAGNESANALELRRLRAEYAGLKATLAARDEELRRLQLAATSSAASAGGAGGSAPQPDRIVLSTDRRKAGQQQRSDMRTQLPPGREEGKSNRIIRDSAIAAVLAISALVFFSPKIETYFSKSTAEVAAPAQGAVGTTTAPAGRQAAAQTKTPATQPRTTAAALPKSTPKVMVVVRTANVHTDPSGVADVIATQQIGEKVTLLEQRGSWTRVQITGTDVTAPPQEGWIYTPYLQETSGTP